MRLLIQLFFGVEMTAGGHGRNVYQANEAAWEDFFDTKASVKVKQNLSNLKSRGFISYSAGKNPQITKAGWERLQSVLPSYDRRRVWDGKIYLVTYDIPEEKKPHREMLRGYLKRIGCGMLQLSVWVTPYDPRGVLRSFIKRSGLEGLVLVSVVGKDGNVAGESTSDLVRKVFKLEDLNSRYREFTDRYGESAGQNLEELRFDFLSILKDDPQLPFPLLPLNWLGGEAFQLYQKSMRSHSNLIGGVGMK